MGKAVPSLQSEFTFQLKFSQQLRCTLDLNHARVSEQGAQTTFHPQIQCTEPLQSECKECTQPNKHWLSVQGVNSIYTSPEQVQVNTKPRTQGERTYTCRHALLKDW